MVDDSSYSRDDKVVKYVVIFGILILVFILIVVFLVKFGHVNFSIFDPSGQVTKHSCRFSFRAMDEFSEDWVFTDYIIKHEGKKLKDGVLMPNIREEFTEDFIDNFTIYAWDDDGKGDDYYAGWKNCSCGEECIIDVKKEADLDLIVNRFVNDTYRISVGAKGGYLNPYLVCLFRSFTVLDIKTINSSRVNLSAFDIPKRLEGNFDDCFFVNHTVRDTSDNFNIEVIKDEFTTDCEFKVCIIDSSFNRFFETSFGQYGIEDKCYTSSC